MPDTAPSTSTPPPVVAAPPAGPPSVVVSLAGRGPVSVVFDLDRLAAIEDATGMSVFEILNKFAELSPKTEDGEAKPSSAELVKALYRQRLGIMNKFLCGALSIKADELTWLVGLRNIATVGNAVRNAFIEAVMQMIGDTEDAAGKPSAQPGTSEPGPASS